jgi:hypothetical protein
VHVAGVNGDECKDEVHNDEDAAMAHDRPGLEIEDDATKAVREAFESPAVNAAAPMSRPATASNRFRYMPTSRC